MSTGEIALIGQPKPDRKTIAERVFHYLGPITLGHNTAPTERFLDESRSSRRLHLDWLDGESTLIGDYCLSRIHVAAASLRQRAHGARPRCLTFDRATRRNWQSVKGKGA